MTEQAVRVERSGPVSTVFLHRPARRNAVDGPTAAQLAAAFRAFDADPDSAVAVLHGEGGVFCSGADLTAIGTERGNRAAPDGDGPMGVSRLRLSKPVIAAVSGYAVAGGLRRWRPRPPQAPLGSPAARVVTGPSASVDPCLRYRPGLARSCVSTAGSPPATSTILVRLDAPATSVTALRRTPNALATDVSAASVALPSTARALTPTIRAPARSPPMAGCAEPGRTQIVIRTSPVCMRAVGVAILR